jgi:uncharacterized protein (TIGR02588 family)
VQKRKDWIIIAVCAVVIAAGLGFVVWRFVRGGGSATEVRVFAGPAVREDGAFRIPITARNEQDRYVRGVTVEVILFRGDEQVERAEAALGSIAPFTEAEGAVTFTNDPKCCAVVAQPK